MCILRTMEQPKTYTRPELCEILKVSLSTVGSIIKARLIYHIRVGNTIRVPDWALDDYMSGRPPQWPDNPLASGDGELHDTASLFSDGVDQ